MHCSLFTATGAYNLGDELILLQEYLYLKNRYPKTTFSIFTYEKESSLLEESLSIKYFSYFPKNIRKRPIQNIGYFLRGVYEIWKSDLIIIWWGWLIYDNEDNDFELLVSQWKLRVRIANFFKKPIIYWSLGIHIKKENEQKILPLFAWKNTYVSVRDSESKKVLESIGIKAQLIRDPVLSYDPEIPKLLVKKRPKIGLSFREGFLENERENIEKIITFLMSRGYEPILLNHSFHRENLGTNDSYFLRDLEEKYQLHSTKSIKETLECYKELEMVVGMRLHSLILATVHAIPFFALSYGKKTDEFIRWINYDFSLAVRIFDIEIFKKRFLELENEKNAQKFALSEKNDIIKREITLTTNTFFDGLERTQK